MQSVGICDYLGKKYGLAGSTPEENALALMTAMSAEDFRIKVFTEVIFGDSKDKFVNETLPRWLPQIERNLIAGNGHFVPSTFTYGDICMFDALQSAITKGLKISDEYPECLIPYPAISVWYSEMKNKPGIKEHLESRLDAPF